MIVLTECRRGAGTGIAHPGTLRGSFGAGVPAVVELGSEASEEHEEAWVAMEYLQFVGALVLFLGILVGSYWFVYAPNRGQKDEEEDQRQAEN